MDLGKQFYKAASREVIEELIEITKNLIKEDCIFHAVGQCEDSPIVFNVNVLTKIVASLSNAEGRSQHVDTLKMRIEALLNDQRLGPIINPTEGPKSISEWLNTLFYDDDTQNNIIIIDLQLIPHDILHLAIAVLSRIIFEFLQRYRKAQQRVLPTVLVLEEAHAFVSKSVSDSDEAPDVRQMCRRTFERIAREGRKFGLGLVISSQRPSELSPTVLAQCNTFLLHRIVNDRDQELVSKLVPDNLTGLLKELPSLPSRHAILLGWATPVPILVCMNELKADHRPQSADPEYWNCWTSEAQNMHIAEVAKAWESGEACGIDVEGQE